VAAKMKTLEEENPVQKVRVNISGKEYTLFTRDLDASIRDLILNRAEGATLLSGPDGKPISDMDARKKLARQYIAELSDRGAVAGKASVSSHHAALTELTPRLLGKDTEKRIAETVENKEMVTRPFTAKDGSKYEVRIPYDDFVKLPSQNLAKIVKLPGVKIYKLTIYDNKIFDRTLLSRTEMHGLVKQEGG
jgi:hypothetical protein